MSKVIDMENSARDIAAWVGGPLVVALAGIKAWFSLKDCVGRHNVRISDLEDDTDECRADRVAEASKRDTLHKEMTDLMHGMQVTMARVDERTKSMWKEIKDIKDRQNR